MSKKKIIDGKKKPPHIEEGPPIWVESLLSSEEWVVSRKLHPNTHHLKDKTPFFKSEYEWRWRMGAGIPEDERNLISKRFNEMRKKVHDENKPDNSSDSAVSDNRLTGGKDSTPQLDGNDIRQDTEGRLLRSDNRSHNLSKLL